MTTMVEARGLRSVSEVSPQRVGVHTTSELSSVLDGVQIPALLLEAPAHEPRVAHTNAAFQRLFGLDDAGFGVALADVLPAARVSVEDGPQLGSAVHAAFEEGRSASLRLLYESSGGADESLRTRWTVNVQPVTAGDAVSSVMVSFLDLSGQLLAGVEADTTAALQDLAGGLTATKPADRVYEDAVRAAALAAGGQNAAILLSDGGARFRAAATSPEGIIEGPIIVEDLSSPVWQACLGRRQVSWSVGQHSGEPPLPFAGEPGWEEMLLVGLRLHGRWQGVLVVGGPRQGTFDASALARLELVAALAGTAADNADMVCQFRRLEELLTGAVATSSALVEATDPATVQRSLLEGLVNEMGLAAAALWCPANENGGGLELTAAVGLPDEVRAGVAALSNDSMAAKLARGAVSGRLRPAATAVAPSSWEGCQLRLVHVPDPAPGVLGIYSDGPLPELVDGVLATLAHGLAAAVHQATLHERSRTVVDSLQSELRPRGVVLPPEADVGWIYQSATTGVDVGGDFIDWFMTERDEIGVACGDVSGKGVEAASLTAMAVYTLRAFALRGTTAAIVLNMLNASVVGQTPTERFITMAYAKIDPGTWHYQLALAGHPTPIVVGPEGSRTVDVAPDVPVGIDAESTFGQQELELAPGEALVLYTDGVTEARAGDGPLFGLERLLEVLDRFSDADARGMADGVGKAVEQWTDDGTNDDIAVVVIRRTA